MSSLKSYVETAYQKDLINQLLKQVYSDIPAEDHEEMIELISTKLYAMVGFRTLLEKNFDNTLIKIAETNGAGIDQILDAFLYFSLIVENTWLTKQLAECQPENKT